MMTIRAAQDRRQQSFGSAFRLSARPAAGRLRLSLVVSGCLAAAASSSAGEPPTRERPERNVEGIMDNSFLVEEAYNQEKGVVQHIFNAVYGRDHEPGPDTHRWSLVFTEEWPLFSQTHQLSYTVPYNFQRAGGRSDDGFGDILLNYRYQAWLNEANLLAFAPRASLVLPTGDADLGFGHDAFGAQFNLPFSVALGDYWFAHLNAGLTYLPDAGAAQDRDLLHYNLGASLIYAWRRDVHFLVEWVGYWDQFGERGLPLEYEFSSAVSPGLRYAFNFVNDSQLVVGAAVPIGLNQATPDIGAFLYLSFEHFFQRP